MGQMLSRTLLNRYDCSYEMVKDETIKKVEKMMKETRNIRFDLTLHTKVVDNSGEIYTIAMWDTRDLVTHLFISNDSTKKCVKDTVLSYKYYAFPQSEWNIDRWLRDSESIAINIESELRMTNKW